MEVLSYHIHKPYIIVTTFARSFTGLLITMLYGVSSNPLTDSSDKKVMGTMTVEALGGALSSIWTIHNKGPRYTLILSSDLFIVGSILIGVDPLAVRVFYKVVFSGVKALPRRGFNKLCLRRTLPYAMTCL